MVVNTETIARVVSELREYARTLEEFGAPGNAKAVAKCIALLEEALSEDAEETVTVEEAFRRTGAARETIRRAVRRGDIVDLRDDPRGKMRIRVADLPRLAGKARHAPEPDRGISPAVAALARL